MMNWRDELKWVLALNALRSLRNAAESTCALAGITSSQPQKMAHNFIINFNPPSSHLIFPILTSRESPQNQATKPQEQTGLKRHKPATLVISRRVFLIRHSSPVRRLLLK